MRFADVRVRINWDLSPMTKPLKLTLQITGEMSEEKKLQLIGFLEANIRDAVGRDPEHPLFTFGEGDVVHSTSADESVRIILLCCDVGRLTPSELTTIMHSLSKCEVVAGEYGIAFPSLNSAKLTRMEAA